MAICLGLAVMLTSCNGNEDEPVLPGAEIIEGSYFGDLSCKVLDTTLEYENLTVAVTANDDATVTIHIPQFGGNGHNTLPAFDIPGAEVSEQNGTYLIAAPDFSGTNDKGQAYSGTLQGEISQGKLTLEFVLRIGAMPMPMTCTFEGLERDL